MKLRMLGSEWFDARPGGLNRYFENLWSALDESGSIPVEAAAFGAAPDGGMTLGPTGMGMRDRLQACHTWGRRVDADDFRDYHFALYAAAAARRRRGSGLDVVHFHGPWAAESAVAGDARLKAWGKRRLELSVLRDAAQVVVLSHHFAELVLRDYGVNSARIQIIPGGVDVERFRPAAEVVCATRGRLVVAVRRLEDRMGLDVLLEAWPRVLARHPDARLLIIGDGSARGKLERLKAALDVESTVDIVGRQSDDFVISAYQEAEVSVVPSTSLEGFGLIALESLACGTPSVVTRCGGLPAVVSPLSEDLVVGVGDPLALAEAVSTVLDGTAPSEAECRSYAERYAWDRVARKHLDLYSSLA